MSDIDDKTFSQLQLGIRELFRIVIPGAYVFALIQFISPHSEVARLVSSSTFHLLTIIFFLGLVGYALRVHERWWPYSCAFERERKRLNDTIVRLIDGDVNSDNVSVYKYFLEAKGGHLKDRVHYFTSFYYMLAELSVFSVVSAIGLMFFRLLQISDLLALDKVVMVACLCVFLAILLQVFLLYGNGSIRLPWERRLAPLPLILVTLGIVVLILSCLKFGGGPLILDLISDYRIISLMILSIVFGRLGTKQWTSIVGEQIVLVRERASELIVIASNYTND